MDTKATVNVTSAKIAEINDRFRRNMEGLYGNKKGLGHG